MKKDEDKNICCGCASDKSRLQEIKDNITIIGNRASWMLGVLVLISLGLASFIFGDSPINSAVDKNSLAWAIKVMARSLFGFYLLITAYYTWRLIVPNFGLPIHENRDDEDLQETIKLNAELSTKLANSLTTLIVLFIAAVPFSFFLTFIIWHFSA